MTFTLPFKESATFSHAILLFPSLNLQVKLTRGYRSHFPGSANSTITRVSLKIDFLCLQYPWIFWRYCCSKEVLFRTVMVGFPPSRFGIHRELSRYFWSSASEQKGTSENTYSGTFCILSISMLIFIKLINQFKFFTESFNRQVTKAFSLQIYKHSLKRNEVNLQAIYAGDSLEFEKHLEK